VTRGATLPELVDRVKTERKIEADIGMSVASRKVRVLDFDMECRPLAWYGGEWVTKQPTVIAWAWCDKPKVISVAAIGESDRSSRVLEEEETMIEEFRLSFDEAEMVTGHFIRGFDLTLLNGACLRLGIPGISSKLSQDTKLDLVRSSGLSKSMANLSAMLEAKHQKLEMNTAKWARANMLLPDGIKMAKERCVADVREHMEMREIMLANNMLRPPIVWDPEPSGQGNYHA
jgi:hypothetical protein